MKKLLTTIIFLIGFNFAQSQSLVTQAAAIASFYPGHITAADLKNFAFSVCTWCGATSGGVDSIYMRNDSLFYTKNTITYYVFNDKINLKPIKTLIYTINNH